MDDTKPIVTETQEGHTHVLCQDLTQLRSGTLVRIRLKNKSQSLCHTRCQPWKSGDRWYVLLEGKVARYRLNDILAVIQEPGVSAA
jgi:hypothetical protein